MSFYISQLRQCVFQCNCIFHNCTIANLVSVTLYLVMLLIAHSVTLAHNCDMAFCYVFTLQFHNFTLYPMHPIPMQLFCSVTLYFAIAASLFLVIVILCFAMLPYFL